MQELIAGSYQMEAVLPGNGQRHLAIGSVRAREQRQRFAGMAGQPRIGLVRLTLEQCPRRYRLQRRAPVRGDLERRACQLP